MCACLLACFYDHHDVRFAKKPLVVFKLSSPKANKGRLNYCSIKGYENLGMVKKV